MWLEEVQRLLAATPVRRKPAGNGFVASAVLVPLYVAAGELWLAPDRGAPTPSPSMQVSTPSAVARARRVTRTRLLPRCERPTKNSG